MKVKNIAYSLIVAIAVVIILIYGKKIILPFVLAILIWFLIKVIRNGIKRIKINQNPLPLWIQNILAFITVFGALTILGKVLASNVAKISQILPLYEANIQKMLLQLNELSGLDVKTVISNNLGQFDFANIVKSILNSITDVLSKAFIVVIYVLFLLLEEAFFPYKIKAIFHEEDQFHKVNSVVKKLNKSINSYISLKTLVSLITGVVSYIALRIIDIDFAFFWAFLIFVLNFIPTIGSLIATLFPSLVALLQYTSFSYFFLVLAIIGAVQIAVGNFLEPRIMGQNLNISPLVVILSLMFWGAIWGILGMLLSVPIMVMLIIVFAQFDNTRGIAIMLSARGSIDQKLTK
jgi:AI-2 transport protein TqsA